LLESIFDTSAAELLGPPQRPGFADDALQEAADYAPTLVADWERQAAEVARLVALSGRVDQEALDLLALQVESTRRLDRRFGAATLLGALRLHAEHIEHLLMYATDAEVRRSLAAVLTDAHALAGWQSLDRGEIVQAWRHYAKSCDAAMATDSTTLYALALAKQAVVLSDVGRTVEGVEMSGRAREIGRTGSALVCSWLAAAHGEALAAAGQRAQCLRAFDRAYAMLPAECVAADGPYLGLDTVHLARWRGHALARVGDPEAVPVLTGALQAHDAEFTRAEAALHVDLMLAHLAADDTESAIEERQRRSSSPIPSAPCGSGEGWPTLPRPECSLRTVGGCHNLTAGAAPSAPAVKPPGIKIGGYRARSRCFRQEPLGTAIEHPAGWVLHPVASSAWSGQRSSRRPQG
jgi:tetratricopeptide (TPR) repeat protein